MTSGRSSPECPKRTRGGYCNPILRALQIEQDALSQDRIPDTADARMASAQLAAARAAVEEAMKELENDEYLDKHEIQRLMSDFDSAERLASDAIKHAQQIRSGTTSKDG